MSKETSFPSPYRPSEHNDVSHEISRSTKEATSVADVTGQIERLRSLADLGLAQHFEDFQVDSDSNPLDSADDGALLYKALGDLKAGLADKLSDQWLSLRIDEGPLDKDATQVTKLWIGRLSRLEDLLNDFLDKSTLRDATNARDRYGDSLAQKICKVVTELWLPGSNIIKPDLPSQRNIFRRSIGEEDRWSQSRLLRTELENACAYSAIGGVQYLPLGSLRIILTRKVVERELSQQRISHMLIKSLAANICDSKTRNPSSHSDSDSMLKIFATLTLIDRLDTIREFVQETIINDSDLPLAASLDQSCLYPNWQHRDESSRIYIQSLFEANGVTAFVSRQWLFLAPCFIFPEGNSKEIPHYELQDMCPLPFKNIYDTTAVIPERNEQHVRIEGSHYNHNTWRWRARDEYDTFTLTHLGAIPDVDFKNWIGLLEKVQDETLAEQCLTIRHGKQYYVLGPSKKTDIEHFLKNAKQSGRNSLTEWAQWIAEQSACLAGGLSNIHELMYSEVPQPNDSPWPHLGWHGGIGGSQSILWLGHKDNGRLKGVRGSLKLSYLASCNRLSLTYRAPESRLGGSGFSQEADIWALGCVFLTLVVWHLRGWEGVELFSKARTHEEEEFAALQGVVPGDKFWMVFVDDDSKTQHVRVKRSVIQWIEEMEIDLYRSPFSRDLLSLVSGGMLQIDPNKRLQAGEVALKCRGIKRNGWGNPSYLNGGMSSRMALPITTSGQSNNADHSFRRHEASQISKSSWQVFDPKQLQREEVPDSILGHEFFAKAKSTSEAFASPLSLPTPLDTGYIEAITAHLHQSLPRFQGDASSLFKLSNSLTHLLPSFAQKLVLIDRPRWGETSKVMQRFPSRIQTSLERRINNEVETHEALNFDNDSMTRAMDLSEDEDQDGDQAITSFEDLRIHHNIRDIKTTSAYQWLVRMMQKEAGLRRANPDVMASIRQTVIDSMPSQTDALQVTAIFDLEWDPRAFLAEQSYETYEALLRAITITGTEDDAQALTAEQYIFQTWSAEAGDNNNNLLNLILEVVSMQEPYTGKSSTLDIGATVEVRYRKDTVYVTATGYSESLAEVAQQLGWLGAALRTSPRASVVATCSPNIRLVDTKLSRTRFAFAFETKLLASQRGKPGQCWHTMFKAPVIVVGYPIRAKSHEKTGIEMPLNLMGALVGSERVVEFFHNVYIKGFAAMLCAAKVCGDLLIWHYYRNDNNERVSYLEALYTMERVVSFQEAQRLRHIIGWCSDCSVHTGAADAIYKVERSRLPRPHATMLLDKATISGGMFIRGGLSFAMGVRDGSPHLLRNSYIPKLQWIAKRYVVLWDEAVKKGWLVNGTSALLHVVRASLEHYRTDDFSTAFQFNPTRMRNASGHMPNSAVEVLINEDNRALVLYHGNIERSREDETTRKGKSVETSISYKEKQGNFLFEDLVEQHYNALEQIIEHQRRVGGRNGVDMKMRLRKHLEGWDFAEVATGLDPDPRVATLDSIGYGWVDFIRSIEAVTLMGKGFGELIQPAHFRGMCPRWGQLPIGRYYLAVTMFDMQRIVENFGDESAEPLKATENLIWHCAGEAVAPCQCQRGARLLLRHHDPVQAFYPTTAKRFLPLRGLAELSSQGAVVFGHNINWSGFHWGESGGEDRPGEGNKAPLVFIRPSLSRIPRRILRLKPSTPGIELSTGSQSSSTHDGTSDQVAGSSTSTSGSAYLSPPPTLRRTRRKMPAPSAVSLPRDGA
ncbi:hypothetical protein HJFPF1_07942 [Paramyrothecium foliicola]|nr:hypothetical protein HJFPF1_07942 [Paramyrothecium foliicola]